ncbi:GTP cyclohydrolase II [Coemansia spiralis]|nr:GTP cyclohydrolase II [Coemansia spiralis]
MSMRFPGDLAAAAASTPVEGRRGRVREAHFNASLDQALLLLEQQDDRDAAKAPLAAWDSAVPVLPSPAADDLVTDASTCCNSRASTASPGDRIRKQAAAGLAATGHQDVAATCQVRARIPYPGGHFYLHVYHTDEDSKEHLAVVFGDDIRSATLEVARGAETDAERRIRGASTGPLRRLVAQDIARRTAAPERRSDSESDTDSESDERARRIGGLALGGFDADPAETFAATRLSVVDAPLVRIHSECFTGETVSSVRCDCGYQLAEAMRLMQEEGRGVIVYLRQEGRGIGLLEKLKAYNLQDQGHDTVDANLLLNHPADARTYGSATAILADLGISRLRLLTNNADKIRQLRERRGSRPLEVVCHVPMLPRWWAGDASAQLSFLRHLRLDRSVMSEADKYLRTKVERMGHMLAVDTASAITIPRPPTSALYTQDA